MDLSAPADIAARDQAVGDMYQRFLEPTLDQRAVVGLVSWGMSDRYTWLVPASSPSFARPDHLPIRPLPFDEEFRPKAAYTAILRSLQSAPVRPPWTPK
jgi:endo-1,4-beta-xylanase